MAPVEAVAFTNSKSQRIVVLNNREDSVHNVTIEDAQRPGQSITVQVKDNYAYLGQGIINWVFIVTYLIEKVCQVFCDNKEKQLTFCKVLFSQLNQVSRRVLKYGSQKFIHKRSITNKTKQK